MLSPLISPDITIVQPQDILAYASCPLYCKATFGSSRTSPPEVALVGSLIKRVYNYHARHGELVDWKRVRRWIEESLSKNLEYREIKGVLLKFQYWYDLYLKEYCDKGVANLPVVIKLDNIMMYRDMVPLVTTGKKLRLYDFRLGTRDYPVRRIFNDLLAQARIWGLWRAAEVMPEEYVRIVIAPESIRMVRMNVLPDVVEKKIEPIVRQILRGIRDEVWYPAISVRCDGCAFKPSCSL